MYKKKNIKSSYCTIPLPKQAKIRNALEVNIVVDPWRKGRWLPAGSLRGFWGPGMVCYLVCMLVIP